MKIIKNIPNMISVSRIPLAFAFIFTFFESGGGIVPLSIIFISGVTDVLDGMIARGFGLTSDAGELLDPGADKLFQCVVIACMCICGYVPLWLMVAYIFKESLFVSISFVLLEKRNTVVQSNVFGKTSTVVYYIFISTLLLVKDAKAQYGMLYYGMCFAMAVMIFLSAVAYFVSFVAAARSSDTDN